MSKMVDDRSILFECLHGKRHIYKIVCVFAHQTNHRQLINRINLNSMEGSVSTEVRPANTICKKCIFF